MTSVAAVIAYLKEQCARLDAELYGSGGIEGDWDERMSDIGKLEAYQDVLAKLKEAITN